MRRVKRLRTKLTQNQKERMLEFAQRVEWKLRKGDEEQINEFCSKIGVEKRVFKIWLHNNKKKNFATSTADILPECLIQNILCLLSVKEAAKMSILSKTWLHAWKTLSTLKFTVEHRNDSVKIVDDIMERYRDGKIPIEKFELSNSVISSEIFGHMIDKWLHIALQNGVKDLVFGDHSFRLYPLPIFEILAAKSLRELVLSNCDLMSRVSVSSGVTNCKSLRNLSLEFVNLDENMLQTLLNSCPSIVNFNFKYCSGLEKIELLNLRRIESVSIRTHRQINQLVKIQAPTLEHLSYTGLSKELEVVECQSLKSLDLSYVTTSDGFLQSLISTSQSLEVLKIRDCKGIGEIDFSNLVSLEYIGYQIPQIKTAREPRQLKHSKIVLKCNNLNVAWFCKLQKFLSTLTYWSEVSLSFYECNEITMKNLKLHHRVATPQVGVLNVNIEHPARECPTFMDALLWSCHPRRLYVNSTVEITQCLIGRLMDMKNSSYLTSYGSCNRRYSPLKDIKAFDGKNKPLKLTGGELAGSTLHKGENIYFLLDW